MNLPFPPVRWLGRLILALHLALIVATAAAYAAEPVTGPAAIVGDWRVGPVVNQAGSFTYCIAEARFDNGVTLFFARSRRDELNIGLRLPEGQLGRNEGWKVRLAVDTTTKRERQAVAGGPDMLVIANGSDEPLFEALAHGDLLTINGPKDALAFRLIGTGKALPDLRTCVERARAGVTGKPLARIGSDAVPQLPPALARLLADAGFTKIGLMPINKAPAGHGALAALWRVAPVTSGYREAQADDSRSLPGLIDAELLPLKARCRESFDLTSGEPLTRPGVSIRTAEVTCGEAAGVTHIALTFLLDRAGLFRVFFHEAPAAEATAANRTRDAIAGVLKSRADQ